MTDMENLDEEVKELLLNYRFKKATVYEPCTLKNFRECLIGINEELTLLNIEYIFNPHIDVKENSLTSEALVRLINSIWILLNRHKSCLEKAQSLEQLNFTLEHKNKDLCVVVGRLKNKVASEKNESKACIASAQRVTDQSNEIYQKMLDLKAKLTQLSKQKESNEKYLQNKITRLTLENEKLLDRLKNKSDNFTSCADICDTTVMQLKERERKQRTLIAQLQCNNQDLLREVLALKEQLILEGIENVKVKK